LIFFENYYSSKLKCSQIYVNISNSPIFKMMQILGCYRGGERAPCSRSRSKRRVAAAQQLVAIGGTRQQQVSWRRGLRGAGGGGGSANRVVGSDLVLVSSSSGCSLVAMNETDTREVHGLWHAVDDATTQRSSPEEGVLMRSSPEEGDSPKWQQQRCITAKIGGQLEVEDEGNKVISPAFPLCEYEK
jgi:hypothetical protein